MSLGQRTVVIRGSAKTTSVSITSVFPTECPEEQKDSSGLARWIIVLIVCGPVIVNLLILVGIQKVSSSLFRARAFEGYSLHQSCNSMVMLNVLVAHKATRQKSRYRIVLIVT